MKYDVRLKPSAEKSLEKLPEKDQQKVKAAIVGLAGDPFSGKKLFGKWQDHYSIRAWPYRIIYRVYKGDLLVLVVEIGHRQGIY